jgi:GH15 family glucan-1,4-alpha-glucosidase
MPSRIEDYALIGNCESAAMVGRNGSIDWLALPRFDSAACFAALLGGPENGRWLIAPTAESRVTRHYREGTLVLETRFETPDGAVTLMDGMGRRDGCADLVRIIRGERGRVAVRMELVIRCEYGSIIPWVRRLDDGRVTAVAGPDRLTLSTPAAVHGENLRSIAEFDIAAGEEIPFSLTWSPSYRAVPAAADAHDTIEESTAGWLSWSCSYKAEGSGEWSEAVLRSLITLKALTHLETGGIVAAATTSLPEQLGGPRNWDYRFCWLRDAHAVHAAQCRLPQRGAGLERVAAARDRGQSRPDPDHVRDRRRTPHDRMGGFLASGLRGFAAGADRERGASPALARRLRRGDGRGAPGAAHRLATHESGWKVHLALLDYLAKIWKEPDEGIWEVRGGR